MATERLPSRGQNPRNEVSVKPGLAQSMQSASMSTSGMAAEDRRRVFTMRRALEQWGGPEGQTSVGMSGVDPRRFRGVVRFLEAYAAGQDTRTCASVQSTSRCPYSSAAASMT